jgi:hypothetical protein
MKAKYELVFGMWNAWPQLCVASVRPSYYRYEMLYQLTIDWPVDLQKGRHEQGLGKFVELASL